MGCLNCVTVTGFLLSLLANGDSLGQLRWQLVENGDDVCTYEPGANPVPGPGYEDNIKGLGTDGTSFLQLRFYVTSEDVGEYLCHVRGVPSREEGENQEIINVVGVTTTTTTTTTTGPDTTTTTAAAGETTTEGSGDGEDNGGASTLKLSLYSLLLIFYVLGMN